MGVPTRLTFLLHNRLNLSLYGNRKKKNNFYFATLPGNRIEWVFKIKLAILLEGKRLFAGEEYESSEEYHFNRSRGYGYPV